MTTRIVEILARSTQGITRPFLCRGDDGGLYYVKANAAGRKALISEWIAGNVAQRLNLPIPSFKQAIIPPELVTLSARDDIADLGAGTGFASQLIENADELSYLFINQIDATLRAKILLFDWWMANGDRTLTEFGGNPNILWLHRDSKPYIIDHNMAFDETASHDFWSHHIFAADRPAWTPRLRTEMETLMTTALDELPAWWNTMPAEWTEIDTGLTFDSVRTLLWRFRDSPATFWEAQ
jgi:hypothetical protein